MPEYTLLTLVILAGLTALDLWLLRTRLLRQVRFWLTYLAVLPGKALLNGYLTAVPIVSYHAPYYLGWRLGTIPVEDFIYLFDLLLLTLILWQKLKSLCPSSS